MLRSLAFRVVCVVALFCAVAVAQQPESQLPDAPQPQPQAQPPPPPPPSDEQPKEEKKPESKMKRTLKRGAPSCIKIGGAEKCKAPGTDDDEAGSEPPAPQQPKVPNSQPLPRSSSPEESSSKDSEVPLTPPAGEEGSAPASDVLELHPYNPHKADKNVEVGDFYFKRNNYRAAESRYAEALDYMPNHAVATYKLAEAQDKLGKTALARANYEKYLKILPSGEFAGLAKAALARLDAQAKDATSPPVQKRR
ncbi:MAG: tol-pal system YbgF family protein [Terriglobales bacterium]